MPANTFKHMDPDGFHGKQLSLHDCIANKILFENNTLCFCLPDGFWVTPQHDENASDKVVRTDVSVVAFSIEDMDDITVRVFHKKDWSRKETVELWHVEQLISMVNSGKCTIEFITQYRTYGEQMWQCVLHAEKKPYYREMQLYLPKATATFCWNRLRMDRQW